jgi:hypothetical protein
MSLIAKETKPPRKQHVSIRLDAAVLDLLEGYCEFISSSQSYVISQSLLITFRKDKEFQSWFRAHWTTRKRGRSGDEHSIGITHE